MPTLHESILDALSQAASCDTPNGFTIFVTHGAAPAKAASKAPSVLSNWVRDALASPACGFGFEAETAILLPIRPDPVITIDIMSAGPFGNTIPTPTTTPPRRNLYDLIFADLAHSRRSSEGVYIFVGPTSCLTLPAAVAAYTGPNPRLHTAQAALMLYHPDPKTPSPNGMSTSLLPYLRRLAAPTNVIIH